MEERNRYVKLTKEQKPVEDIEPGELNQPIDVPQVWILISIFFLFDFCCFNIDFYNVRFCLERLGVECCNCIDTNTDTPDTRLTE